MDANIASKIRKMVRYQLSVYCENMTAFASDAVYFLPQFNEATNDNKKVY